MSTLPSEALLQGNEGPTPPLKARAEVRGDRASLANTNLTGIDPDKANLASVRGKVKASAKVVVSRRTTARFANQ